MRRTVASWLGLVVELAEDFEDIAEDLDGWLRGIDEVDQVGRVAAQEVLGFLLINLEPSLDDFEIGVVEAVLLEGTALHAGDQLSIVRAGQIQNREDIEGFVQDFGLRPISGQAIEYEEMVGGIKEAGLGFGLDVFAPETDGELVGDEPALARVVEESAAEVGFGPETAEDFAAGAVIIAGDGAEDFALGALAGTWRPKEQNGAVPHGEGIRAWRLYDGR